MTRVTKAMPKISYGVAFRSISSSASYSSGLLNSSNERSSSLSKKVYELKQECQKHQLESSKAELINRLDTHNYRTAALRRPITTPPTQAVFRPLMHAFQTSTLTQPARYFSTIDHLFLPSMLHEQANNSPFSIRVPLLPDNYSTDIARAFHTSESLDTAVPPAEIVIVAANPASTTAAAMTEVVGNAGLEENIEVLSSAAAYQPWKADVHNSDSKQQRGISSDLWNGVLDVVRGPKRASSSVVA